MQCSAAQRLTCVGCGAGRGGSGRRLLHAGRQAKKGQTDLLTLPFLRKYIEFCKSKGANLVLTPDASEYIVAEYTKLRTKEHAVRTSSTPHVMLSLKA